MPVYAGFVLTGVITTLLGPLIPVLAAKWRVGDDKIGYMFTAQFVGALCGTLATGSLFRRLGYVRPIAAAFFLMFAGTVGLALSPWPAGLASVLINGLGLGIVIPGTNLYVAEAATSRPAAALSTLNFLWGVGAVSGPPAIAMISRTRGMVFPHFALAILLAITGVLIIAVGERSHPEWARAEPGAAGHGRSQGRGLAVLIALFIFLYVGMENSIGGWAAAYAGRITTWPESAWPLVPLVFWGALMAGRGAAPPVLGRITEHRLVLAALAGAVAGNVVIISAASGAALIGGTLIAGLSFATLYPITVATLSRIYGSGAAQLGSFVFGMAALGGATLPWVVGLVSERLGSLRLGLLVPLAASVAMIGLHASITAAWRRPENR